MLFFRFREERTAFTVYKTIQRDVKNLLRGVGKSLRRFLKTSGSFSIISWNKIRQDLREKRKVNGAAGKRLYKNNKGCSSLNNPCLSF